MDCLDNLVGKRFWSLKGGSRKGDYYSAKKNALDRAYSGRVWENLVQPPWKTAINRLNVQSTDISRKKVGSLKDFHKVRATKRNRGDGVGSLT